MKKLIILMAMLAFATTAMAAGQMFLESDMAVNGSCDRDMFYCQNGADGGPYIIAAGNAQVFYQAELADDVPADLAGQSFNQVGAYVIQWGGGEHDPIGLWIHIYDEACPPGMVAVASYYFLWTDLVTTMMPEGYWVYGFEALLPDVIAITANMSIGFQVDMGATSEDPPWAGVLATDVIYGCDESYREFHSSTSDIPRWTAYSVSTGGAQRDIAYCLGLEGTATEDNSWSKVKALY